MTEEAPLRVAVDLDDVVLDFFPTVIAGINDAFGTDISVESCKDWDDNPVKHLDCFGAGRSWWDWLKENSYLWAACPPVKGAADGVNVLQMAGFKVECLTSKPVWARWVVWTWLHTQPFSFDSVTIVPTGESKVDWSGADVLVDDAVHNIEAWEKAGRFAVVFDRPWNQECRAPRAFDWDGVINHVFNHEQERLGVWR